MKAAIILTSTLILTSFIQQTDFLTEQKKYERVKTAYKDKGQVVTEKLKKENIELNELNILIKVFKEEKLLEIYAKKKTENNYKKILNYDICASSGELGPKRKEGDNQVPEGFYHINVFNPTSNYYLSLGINYPNESDKKKSKSKNLGGNIFIHGSCVTIGCIPMTDDKIKEIYIYAIQARQNGQLKIPVYIFPFKMTEPNIKKYLVSYKDNIELLKFWNNLKTGYDKFESDKKELKVTINNNGDYSFDN